MSTSETPRTDEVHAQINNANGSHDADFSDMLNHARQLERELTAAKAEVERLTIDIEAGFMKGAYARLKELQIAEQRRDAWKKMAGELSEIVESESSEFSCPCIYCENSKSKQAIAAYEKLLKEDGG